MSATLVGSRAAGARGLRQMAEATLLEVSKLTAGYGNTPVLFDVGISVRPGELVALIGANGAGKSTLLGAMTGLVQVSAGSVGFDGRTRDRLPARSGSSASASPTCPRDAGCSAP